MATTAHTPRRKPARTIGWFQKLDTAHGILRITVGGETTYYHISPVAAEWGAGYQLCKLNDDVTVAEVYHICASPEGSTCECKGFLKHGHCKHIDGLKVLADNNRL